MYRVVTISLSKDARQAGRQFGTLDRGEMSSGELTELLRGFEKATSAEREDAEIRVTAKETSGVIRCVGGQLLLSTRHEAHLREHSLGPMDVIEHLDRSTTWTPFDPRTKDSPPLIPAPERPAPPRPGAPSALNVGVSLVGLLAGLVGVCVGLRAALAQPPAEPAPRLLPFEQTSEQAALLRNVIGTYTTGPAVGDRSIRVKPDGVITFDTSGAKGTIDAVTDHYRSGQIEGTPSLATDHNGVVEVQGADLLVYCRDVYHRLP